MTSIIITGASSGIGAALAVRLARPGCRLGLLGRNAERLETVSRTCSARGATVEVGAFDLTDEPALEAYCRAFEEGGPVDMLINNAGILAGRDAEKGLEDADTAIRVLDTNLRSAIRLTGRLVPAMQARGEGKIVFVSSLAAFSPLADAPAYSAAKAGLVSYALAMRQALKPDGISVVVSCPGYVKTPMGEIHKGSRPHEISADDAAARILNAAERNRAISGFPPLLYWSSRLSTFVPERLQKLATAGLRFTVSRPVNDRGDDG